MGDATKTLSVDDAEIWQATLEGGLSLSHYLYRVFCRSQVVCHFFQVLSTGAYWMFIPSAVAYPRDFCLAKSLEMECFPAQA